VNIDVSRVTAGDVIIINGNIADHGLAVMARREGLAFDTQLASDVAPLNGLIADILATGADVKFMRDPTRSGPAGLLADLAAATQLSIEIDEAAIPISAATRHAAELLGIDPLTVANEGKCVMVVAPADAERVLAACHAHPLGRAAMLIGRVVDTQPALVELVTHMGGRRIIQRPYGEELPRIC
jgi:hydrogenase expression/formation protein HypE